MTLLWAAMSVAVLHTLLPIHWLPYVTVARSNGLPVSRLMGITLAGTLIHLASTAVLSTIAIALSSGASHEVGHTMEWIGASVLLVLAACYLFLPAKVERLSDRLTWFIAVGVGIQPCFELVPLIVVAAFSGPAATAVVGVTWAVTTILSSMTVVLCAYGGVTLGWTKWIATHANVLTGLVLLLSGVGLFIHRH